MCSSSSILTILNEDGFHFTWRQLLPEGDREERLQAISRIVTSFSEVRQCFRSNAESPDLQAIRSKPQGIGGMDGWRGPDGRFTDRYLALTQGINTVPWNQTPTLLTDERAYALRLRATVCWGPSVASTFFTMPFASRPAST